MKKAPKIKLTAIRPANNSKPFLKLNRNLCKIQYPDGIEKEMTIDSIERIRPDAVTIIPYTMKRPGGKFWRAKSVPYVWLRSAIRPAAALRKASEPDFESDGNLWELPAGIIDPGETAVEAAARECYEEVGFECPTENFKYIGKILSMPSMLAEMLYFYAVLVHNTDQKEPTLDGSPLEYGGELTCVSLKQLSNLIEQDKILDMKTNLGLRMLKEKLNDTGVKKL